MRLATLVRRLRGESLDVIRQSARDERRSRRPSQIQQPYRFFDLTLPYGFSVRFGYAVSTVVPASAESDRHQRAQRRALLPRVSIDQDLR